jgi:hypothetical protein
LNGNTGFDDYKDYANFEPTTMSASKLDRSGAFKPVSVESPQIQLSLPAHAVRIHKSGIEFRAANSIPVWNEMTVSLQSPGDRKKVNFNGVVVACHGNRHSGYLVSMVITSLSKQSQERLQVLAESSLA